MDQNLIVWIEIPVINMERAITFYEKVFRIKISLHKLEGFVMGWFPNFQDKNGTSGALVKHDSYIPSNKAGPLLYFSCKDLSQELDRIKEAGGNILQDKTAIGEGHGYMALFLDCEGNRIALHSST
ncbi:VOC family protein [Eudoraea chungangensis]|uniref:VOC family protein n=1 Tax=Eudoraea chungangensis TaxID=1481905 RepID=UPI0023EB3A0C|nr:VOC family protein [Eudoraea chungangensis]